MSFVTRQVRLIDTVLHPCIDKKAYKTSRELKFCLWAAEVFSQSRPMSALQWISLLSWSTVSREIRFVQRLHLLWERNTIFVSDHAIKDLVIKFPIPSSWSSLFLADTKFGGKKSVRSTSSLRGSFRRKIKSHDYQIETMIGSAKYEPEHGAILWRIGQYIESTLPHNFTEMWYPAKVRGDSGHGPGVAIAEHSVFSMTL